jgi:hypothetical protein
MTTIVVNEQERSKVLTIFDTEADPKIVHKGPVAGMTLDGTTVTVSRPGHGLPDGRAVIVSGADQEFYNGTGTVASATADEFELTLPGLPASPATGTPTANGDAVDEITRTDFTVNVEMTGHGFDTDDEVTIADAEEAPYNGTFVVTVVDVDNFTYELQPPATPATGTLYVSDESQSIWLNNPAAIQIESIEAGSTCKIEVAISLALGWRQLGADLSSADDGSIVPLDSRYNFVRVRRSGGTGAVKVHAQL